MRKAEVTRNTGETQVSCNINLDGNGNYTIETSINFLNHMLELFSKHSLIDMDITAKGDIKVDAHHTVEDIGIVLGEALLKAIGNKKGIKRYGSMILPMDEVLCLVAVDFAGRYSFVFDPDFTRENVGDLPSELVYDFFDAVAQNAKLNLQIKFLTPGRNDHHKIEAIFKAFGRAIRQAIEIDHRIKDQIPSTKGML